MAIAIRSAPVSAGMVPRLAPPLAGRGGYRDATDGADPVVRRRLRQSGDALRMAALALSSSPEDGELRNRVSQGRALLAEAVVALAQARVHLPRLRTYHLPIVTTKMGGVESERARLHALSLELMFWNHAYLPPVPQALPLTEEEEEQLAAVVRELRGQHRVGRILTRAWDLRWHLLAGASAVAAPFLGAWLALGTLAASVLALHEHLRQHD